MKTVIPLAQSGALRPATSSLEDFILLMDPGPEQRERMRPSSDLPKWFGYPILKSGFRVHFSRSTKQIRSVLARSRSIKPLVLVFNVSLREFILVLLLRRKCRIISLFQWRSLESLPIAKRIIYRTILTSSEQILVYSRIQEEYVRDRFPHSRVRWMGLYTDTVFFQPQERPTPPPIHAPFLLVPGNHKRNENLTFAIAETLRMPLVRFSSDPTVAEVYACNRNNLVRFLRNPTFCEIRSLYQRASAVLNIADDSEWPVGITTFCEALAMNARILTPNGHSASGYEFGDGTKPYGKVDDPKNVSDWCQRTRECLAMPRKFLSEKSPRILAEQLCSLESAITSWSSLSSLPIENADFFNFTKT